MIKGYYDAKRTYLGIVETVNPNVGYQENQIIPKVVILYKTENGEYPMYDYEYHKIKQSQPAASYLGAKEKSFFGYITEAQLQKAIARTGYIEAIRLNEKDEQKTLKKYHNNI